MPTYTAPLRDMKFLAYELLHINELNQYKNHEEFSPDLIDAVLEEAAKITENVLFPINQSGDKEECQYKDTVVTTPSGFKEAYKTFIEGGWTSLSCNPDYGGQGLPHCLNVMVSEMICSANLSFGMYPGLSHGAYSAVNLYGTKELKETYLGHLVDGTWTGTMCLTEPHCGTDLGLCRTKAVPQDDGSYEISGTKIFISAGEHDLSENIIHLVLARMPDAPEGIKGISLFLVPKFLLDDQNQPDQRNTVTCGSIEHKMGIKASSTCVMNFDKAKGFLVGTPNKGMQAMFTMMNEARLLVGIQGLGLSEVSYQNALVYAKERLQGRSLSGVKHPDKPADPLIVHPEIRAKLLKQKALTEGCRALGLWVSKALDVAHSDPDARKRQDADDLIQIMTPIIKAFFSDLGHESTNIGIQILGGHGYVHDYGMEQFARDARITQIYEGTNDIQALDLIGRKLPTAGGRYLRAFFHPVAQYIEEHGEDEQLSEFIVPLTMSFVKLQQLTGKLAEVGMKNPEEAASMATSYLRFFSLVALAYMWTLSAQVAMKNMDQEPEFYQAKIETARYFMEKLLPETESLFLTISAGSKTLMALKEDGF